MDLTLRDVFLRLQHVAQMILCVYGASSSYVAVTKLRKYEETSEKLAEWSDKAAHELHKTRTTQSSGALAVVASLFAATTLALFPDYLPKWARICLSPALLVGVLFARGHIKNYWVPRDGKNATRVPLPKMGEYNEALQSTENLLKVLEYLEYSWVATSFVNGMVA